MLIQPTERAEHDRRVNNMSIRKVVAGLLDVYKRQAIYDSEIGNITRSEKNWKDVLKVAGQLYRYEFDNIVMVTAQRPCLLYTSRCV